MIPLYIWKWQMPLFFESSSLRFRL